MKKGYIGSDKNLIMNEKTAKINRICTIIPAAKTKTPSSQPTIKSVIKIFNISLIAISYLQAHTKCMPFGSVFIALMFKHQKTSAF